MFGFSSQGLAATISILLVSTSVAATNQSISASFQNHGGQAEVILRERDAANHYTVRLGADNLEFIKIEKQAAALLGSSRIPESLRYREGQSWMLKATASGNMISAQIFNQDGVEVTSGTVFDRTFEDGEARLVEDGTTQWSKPNVEQLPQYETAPADLKSSYDVIIAGAGTAGSMAAVQATRLGSKVLLVEESDWIGGQMAAAAVASMDEGAEYLPYGIGRSSVRERGLYREFFDFANHLYGTMGLSTDTCYITENHFGLEPRTAQALLYEMFQHERAKAGVVLDVTLETSITSVLKAGNRVTGVELKVDTPEGGVSKTVNSRILIDATEYGDVMPPADVAYRVGNWTSDNIDLSAEEIPEVQDFTWAAVITAYPDGAPKNFMMNVPPTGYNKAEYSLALDNPEPTSSTKPWSWQRFINYRGMPDSDRRDSSVKNPWAAVTKTHMNVGANDGHVDVSDIENLESRRQMEYELKLSTLKLLYYIQNDMTEPVTTWTVALNEGFDTPYNREQNRRLIAEHPDLAPYEDILNQFPPMPYVRESRRMIGVRTILAREIDRRTGPMIFPTSVAVGDYPADLHGTNEPSAIELELDNPEDIAAIGFAPSQLGAFTIPFEAFIPKTIDGFLAAEKNISQTRLVNGATRLQPSTMLIGQAAGAIAGLAVAKRVEPRELHPAEVQDALLDAGTTLFATKYDAHKLPGVALDTELWKSLQLCLLYGIVELKDAQKNLGGLEIVSGETGANGWQVTPHHNLQFVGAGTGLAVYPETTMGGDGSTSASDYTVSATLAKSGGPGNVGVVGRFQDSGNFYHARIHGNKLELWNWEKNKAIKLADGTVKYNDGTSWTISMEFERSRITAALRDSKKNLVKQIILTDSAHAAGYAGVRAQPGAGNMAEFSSLAIKSPEDKTGSAFSVQFKEAPNFATDQLTRGQVAIYMARYLGLLSDSAAAKAIYVDVPAGHSAYRAVSALHEAGIDLNGSASAKKFDPDAPVTRANIAVAIVGALKFPLNDAPTSPRFEDVPPSNPAFRQIQLLAEKNIAAKSLLTGAEKFNSQGQLTIGDAIHFFADLLVHPPAGAQDNVATRTEPWAVK